MVKTKNKNQKSLEIYNITVAQINRATQTVQSWRNALRSAESPLNPNRRLLYDLYAELELDAHIASVREKRILNVLSSNIVFFDKSGKEVKRIRLEERPISLAIGGKDFNILFATTTKSLYGIHIEN